MPDAYWKTYYDAAEKKQKPNGGYEYFQAYTRGMGADQKAYRWAWHAYTEGEETTSPKMRTNPSSWWRAYKLLREAIARKMKTNPCVPCRTPNIWLTEQGVVFVENEKETRAELWKRPKVAEGEMRAYVATGATQLTRQPQVTRFFYYSTRGAPAFDSGLLEASALAPKIARKKAEKTPREIYHIYENKTLYGDPKPK